MEDNNPTSSPPPPNSPSMMPALSSPPSPTTSSSPSSYATPTSSSPSIRTAIRDQIASLLCYLSLSLSVDLSKLQVRSPNFSPSPCSTKWTKTTAMKKATKKKHSRLRVGAEESTGNLSYWFVLSASAFCVAGAGTTTCWSYYSIACELGKVDNLIAFLWLEISLIVEFFYRATHIEDLVGSCRDLGSFCSCSWGHAWMSFCRWWALGVGARAGWCGDLSLWTPTSFMAVFSGFHCTASSLQVLCLPGRSYCPAWVFFCVGASSLMMDSLGVDVVLLRRCELFRGNPMYLAGTRLNHSAKATLWASGDAFLIMASGDAFLIMVRPHGFWVVMDIELGQFREPIRFALSPRLSNKMGLEAAVEAAATFLDKAVKPVMVGGPKLRVAKAYDAFVELADDSSYAVPVMPSAKGMFPEHRPHFIRTYYGAVGTAYAEDAVTKYGCDC
ncbi:hypothetical protein RHSIM_Rhsim06G0200000 [Rhododendron simsii]|uniref:Thiamine pyrophosphate enzyme central domain-containing protein n=1 Tax=Rhododendron simsii TaxID=118357 RepID=A0A834GT82_RHOSS|nr:hypothetical protein RHSIM_Rhsim06G0200000 [Rhododendron simsii]